MTVQLAALVPKRGPVLATPTRLPDTAPVLRYDANNLMASATGPEHGLTEVELSALLREGDRHVSAVSGAWKSGELGFLDLPDDRASLNAALGHAASKHGTYTHVLLLGIGGSSLGTQATDHALRTHLRRDQSPELRVIDNPDPSNVLRQMSGLVPSRTQTVVVSKSGSTLETLSALAIVDDWYARNACDRKKHLTVITGEPAGPLGRYAARHDIPLYDVPANVGGRFSVLSSVGLVPAALLGHDIAAMLSGAAAERDASLAAGGSRRNGPLLAALAHAHLSEKKGKSVSVLMPYHSRLYWFGAWFVQLWAESLGKQTRRSGIHRPAGQTAVAVLGPQAQHSQLQLFLDGPNDKVVTLFEVGKFETEVLFPDSFDYELVGMPWLRGKDFAEIIAAQAEGTRAALRERKRPNATLSVDALTARELGALYMFLELMTAYAAEYLDVNAFDQPAVEIGKRVTKARLSGRKAGT